MGLTEIKTSGIADDAVTTDKLANAINTEITANTAKPSLANDANNRVVTADGSGGLNGEANLAFHGGTLYINDTSVDLGDPQLQVYSEAGPKPGEIGLYSRKGTFASGDDMGAISFWGRQDTGVTTPVQSAEILVEGDGTWANNDYPSRMTFHTTADGASSQSERMRIDSTGDVTITDGDLVIGTGGHGIDFSAQTATSATSAVTSSELLDHYEEGTWLPFVEGSGGSGSTVTYQGSDNRRGYYIRVGKIVTVWCLLGWTDITNGWSGDLQIGGLPFAHDNTDHSNPNGKTQSVGSMYCQNLALPKGDNGWCSPYLYGGYTTKFKIIQSESNGSIEMVAIDDGNNMSNSAIKYIQATFSYPAA